MLARVNAKERYKKERQERRAKEQKGIEAQTAKGASVAEWLECAFAVREVSGSSPGRGGHREPDC